MSGQQSTATASTPIRAMRVTFWGVQGSFPVFPDPHGVQDYSRRLAVQTLERAFRDLAERAKARPLCPEDLLGGPITDQALDACQRRLGLPELPFFGGETTCVQVETAEGNVLIFDAGTGIRRCSRSIVEQWRGRPDPVVHLFGSHEHLDHRMGLTFARFCYARPPFTVNVYGSYRFLHALDQHYALFSRQASELTYVDDPVDYTQMSARFQGVEFRCAADANGDKRRYWETRGADQPLRIGNTTVQPFQVYHGAACCMAYRVEHDGRRFVFCTDHELRRGQSDDPRQQPSAAAESRLRQMCQGADLAYFDGQYYLDEYLGRKGIGSFPPVKRVDWGHGCVEDAVERAAECGIRHTLVGHHDPEREWSHRMELAQYLAETSRQKGCRVELADSDRVIDL